MKALFRAMNWFEKQKQRQDAARNSTRAINIDLRETRRIGTDYDVKLENRRLIRLQEEMAASQFWLTLRSLPGLAWNSLRRLRFFRKLQTSEDAVA